MLLAVTVLTVPFHYNRGRFAERDFKIFEDSTAFSLLVKNVPVNYAIRFTGPVTPSPPAVSGMVSDPTSSASPVVRQL